MSRVIFLNTVILGQAKRGSGIQSASENAGSPKRAAPVRGLTA